MTGHTLVVTGVTVFHRYVCVQYEVTPVPAALREDRSWHEAAAGIAVDDEGIAFAVCRSACRRSRDGSRVMGMLTVGPAADLGAAPVHVSFVPLADAPAEDQPLCEFDLAVGPDGARSILIGRE